MAQSRSSKSSSGSSGRCYVSEDKIPDSFNEVDVTTGPDELLRNLFNFKLLDDAGNFMSFDDLGQGRLGQVIGELVEPLPVDFRRKITDLCCTVAQSMPPAEPTKAEEHIQMESNIDVPLDSLQALGAAGSSSNSTPSSPYPSNIDVVRIQMVPWFETEKLYSTIVRSLHLSELPVLNRINVLIPDIEDWCVDFSYCIPSLWLIGKSGAWYRVSGPLHSGNVSVIQRSKEAKAKSKKDSGSRDPMLSSVWYLGPSSFPCDEVYQSFYAETIEKFYIAAQFIFSLLDIAQFNGNPEFDVIAFEVSARTEEIVSRELILKHASFILEQIQSLETPAPSELVKKPTPYVESRFFKYLSKENEKHSKLNAAKGAKSQTVLFSGAVGEKRKNSSASSTGKSGKKPKEFALNVTPFPDAAYWDMLASNDIYGPPFPYPGQMLCFGANSSDGIGLLMQIHNFLNNFSKMLDIPVFSLNTIASAFSLSGDADHSIPEQCFLLAEIHVEILSRLLLVRQEKISAIGGVNKKCFSLLTTTDRQIDFSNIDINVVDAVTEFLSASGPNSCLLLESDICGSVLKHIKDYVRTSGNAWVEVMRVLIAEIVNTPKFEDETQIDMFDDAVALPEYVDPVNECFSILKFLLSLPEMKQLFPNDSKLALEIVDAGALRTVIHQKQSTDPPKSLFECVNRYFSGGYDSAKPIDPVSNNVAVAFGPTREDTIIRNGDNVDYYCTALSMWVPAYIVEIITDRDRIASLRDLIIASSTAMVSRTKTLQRQLERSDYDVALLRVRCNLWRDCEEFDDYLFISSHLLTKFGARSNGSQFTLPEMKYPSGFRLASDDGKMEVVEDPISDVYRGEYAGLPGHARFRLDVNRLLSSVSDPTSVMITTSLQELFEQLYEIRVAAPLRRVQETIARHHRSCGTHDEEDLKMMLRNNSWNNIVRMLQYRDYAELPVGVRLRCFHLLCNEFIRSSALFDITSTAVKDINDRAANKGNPAEGKEKDTLVVETRASRQKEVARESTPVVNTFDIEPRFFPLGTDRDGRLYWAISDTTASPPKTRLFCEEPLTPFEYDVQEKGYRAENFSTRDSKWYVFKSLSQINKLIEWLSDWGMAEAKLKKAVSAWLLEDSSLYEKDIDGGAHNISTDMFAEYIDEPILPRQLMTLLLTGHGNGTSGTSGENKITKSKESPSATATPTTKRAAAAAANAAAKTPKATPSGKGSQQSTPIPASTPAPLSATPSTSVPLASEALLIHQFWYNQFGAYQSPIAEYVEVPILPSGNLGVRITELFRSNIGVSRETRVFVIGYDNELEYTDPIHRARLCGLRVGDRVVICDGEYCTGKDTIVNAIAKKTAISTDSGGSTVGDRYLQLLVMRLPTPLSDQGLEAEVRYKTELKASFRNLFKFEWNKPLVVSAATAEAAEDNKIVHSASYKTWNPIFGPNKLDAVSSYPRMVLGTLLHLLIETNHPYATPEKWRLGRCAQWPLLLYQQVITLERTLKTRNSGDSAFERESAVLKELVKQCMIELHASLLACDRVFLAATRSKHRLHDKWLSASRGASSWSAIGANLAILFRSIGWSDFEAAISSVPKDRWLRATKKVKTSYVPTRMDMVLYFPKGHKSALDEEQTRSVPPMWSTSSNAFAAVPLSSPSSTSCIDVTSETTVGERVAHLMSHLTMDIPASSSAYFTEKDVAYRCQVTDINFIMGGAPTSTASGEEESSGYQFAQLKLQFQDPFDASHFVGYESAIPTYRTPGFRKALWLNIDQNRPNDTYMNAVKADLVAWVHSFENNFIAHSTDGLASVMEQNIPTTLSVPGRIEDVTESYCLGIYNYTSTLCRALSIVMSHPLFGDFVQLVDGKQYPEYYRLIKSPISLRRILSKALNLSYLSRLSLYEDVMLLRDNCEKFCAGKFPALVSAADRLLYTVVALTERLLLEQRRQWSGESESAVGVGVDMTAVPEPELRKTEAASMLAVDVMSDDCTPSGAVPALPGLTVGSSIYVNIRLCSPSADYIVPYSKYVDCGRFRTTTGASTIVRNYGVGQCLRMRFATDSGNPRDGISTGVIVGHQPRDPDNYVPWEWLEVEWLGDFEGFSESQRSFVNPWEVELMDYPIKIE